MQLSNLTAPEAADMISEAEEPVTIIEGPGLSRTFVLTYGGQDMIIVQDGVSGDAVAVAHNDPVDEAGIHEQARRV